jgi:hypothetical protein
MSDRKTPEKRLLAIVKPPKPVSEMTDDEREAFAGELVRVARARLKPDSQDPLRPEQS